MHTLSPFNPIFHYPFQGKKMEVTQFILTWKLQVSVLDCQDPQFSSVLKTCFIHIHLLIHVR